MKLTNTVRYAISSLLLLQILLSSMSNCGISAIKTLNYSLQSITTPYNKQSFYSQSAFKHTVLLDAGHGGRDHGCTGLAHIEKDFTLAFTKELAAKIEYFSDDITVLHTREYDETVSLERRIAKANEQAVDLFISVHANHGTSSSYHGFETYVYGAASSEVENNLVHREESHEEAPRQKGLAIADHIISEVSKSACLEQSFKLGALIDESVGAIAGLRNRGIKQAEFRVLKKSQVPSILLEVGYLTNPEDVNFLTDIKQRNHLSEALAKSIISHLGEGAAR